MKCPKCGYEITQQDFSNEAQRLTDLAARTLGCLMMLGVKIDMAKILAEMVNITESIKRMQNEIEKKEVKSK